MKFIKTLSALSLGLALSLTGLAQKLKTVEGSLDAIKNEKEINVEFTYDNMKVGKFEKEEEYIANKKAELNTKEPGSGDRWAKNWIADRKNSFEGKFIELFEKSSGMTVSNKAKYTVIVHTTFTEPGYNIYVSKKPAMIDAEAIFVETANRSNKVALVTIDNAPGRTFSGYDYATGDRITEAYAIAGKKLGSYIK